jgi:hypothetical protein
LQLHLSPISAPNWGEFSGAAIPIRVLSKLNYVEKLESVFVIRGLFVFDFVVYKPDTI